MIIGDINILAVVLAAVAGWVVGGIWYGVFGKAWLAALGQTKEQLVSSGGKSNSLPFILAFLANLAMALVLAALARALWPSLPLIQTLGLGILLWAGYSFATMTVNNAFAKRKWALTLIDSGHWLGATIAIAVVLSLFG